MGYVDLLDFPRWPYRATNDELNEARIFWQKECGKIERKQKAVANLPANRLEEIRIQIEEARRLYRVELRESVARVCVEAQRLSKNNMLWSAFINDDRWGQVRRPKSNDQPNALRHALRWVFGRGAKVSKNASFYYRAVAPLIASGVKPKDLPAEIEARGGFKALAAQTAASSKPDGDLSPKSKQVNRATVPNADMLQGGDSVVTSDRPLQHQTKHSKPYDGVPLKAVITGRIQSLVSAQDERPLIVRCTVRFEGPLCHMNVTDVGPDTH